jgi:hypothetical protein
MASDEPMSRLIERSSLGTPAARKLRARTPAEVTTTVLDASSRANDPVQSQTKQETTVTSTEPAIENARKHEYTIVVDGQKKEVPSEIVSYAEVVELAYPGQSADPQYKFTVTYRHAAGEKHSGTLVAGQTVTVKKEGTAFNVTRTTKS